MKSAEDLRLAVTLWLHTRTNRQRGIQDALEALRPIQHLEWVGDLIRELEDEVQGGRGS